MIGWRHLAVAALAPAASPALADVPFLTDDPYLIEPDHSEIAISLDHVALPAADATLLAGSYDAGIGQGTQVGIAVLAKQAGRLEIGELSANAKLAVVAARDGRFALVFRPSLTIPLNDAIRHDIGAILPFYGGVERGDWSFYGGGGYAINSTRDGGRYAFGGVVASRNLGDRWTLGTELGGRDGNEQGPGLVELGAGASVALGRYFTLAGAIYRTLANRGANGDGRAFLTLRYAH